MVVGAGTSLTFEIGQSLTQVVLRDALVVRADAGAPTLWNGVTEVRGIASRPVMVKIQQSAAANVFGNVIASEAAVYKWIDLDQSRGLLQIRTPEYYGRADIDGAVAIALERAEGSLATVLERRIRDHRRGDELMEHLASLAAYAAVATLLSLADVRDNGTLVEGETVPFYAHRDIKPENILIRHQPGRDYDALLADFGYVVAKPNSDRGQLSAGLAAPEQRGTDLHSSLETDLWQVGLMVWRTLHDGMTPFIDDNGTRLDMHDNRVQDVHTPVNWDTDPDPKQDPVLRDSVPLRLARALLVSGGKNVREEAARQMFPEIREAHQKARVALSDPALALQLEEVFPAEAGAAGRKGKANQNAKSFDSTAERIIGLAPSHPAQPKKARVPREPRTRRPRASLLPALRRGAAMAASAVRKHTFFLPGLLAFLGTGLGTAGLTATLALFVGWSQLMPIPSEQIDSLVRWMGVVLLAVAAAVIFVVVAMRRRAIPPNRRRPVQVAAPVLAALAAPAIVAAIVLLVLGQPLDASGTAMLAASAVLAGAAAGRNPLRARGPLRDREAASEQARWEAARHRRPIFTSLVAAGGVLAVGATLFGPGGLETLSNHVVRAETTALVPGAPNGDPVFINPHAIAVNDRGDVAVVDRVGVGRDVVWLVPADGTKEPQRLLSTLSWRTQAAGTLVNVPNAAPLGPLQAGLRDAATPNTGDPVRSIRSITFWSDDQLLLLGEDGVTNLIFDPDAPSPPFRITRLTSALAGNNEGAQIQTDGRYVYVRNAEKTPATEAKYCDYTDATVAAYDAVWWFDPRADTPQPAVLERDTAKGGPSADCVEQTSNIFADGEGVRLLGQRYIGGEYQLTLTTIDTAGKEPGSRSDVDEEITILEHFDIDSSSFARGASTSGGRLIVSQEGWDCVGVLRTSGEVALPAITDARESTGSASDQCADFSSAWRTDVASEIPAITDDAGVSDEEKEAKAAQLRSACTAYQPTGNLLYGDGWLPMASGGPDDAAYIVSQAAVGCTPTVFRLDPDSVDFMPAPNVTSQPSGLAEYVLGETAIMSATKPYASGAAVYWNAPTLGQIESGPNGTGWQSINSFSAINDRPRMVLRGSGYLRVDLGSNDDTDATELAVLRSTEEYGVSNRTRLTIPGLTDMAIYDGQYYIARCGQIFRTTFEALQALPMATPENLYADPASLTVEMLVGSGSINDECAAPTDRPAAGETKLAEADLAPVALEVSLVDDHLLITYADVGRFGDDKVSRIRVADITSSTLRTVGYDPDDSVHSQESNNYTGDVLLGDIGRLGLVPTDVSRSRDGLIVVSTASKSGTGPVLLLRDGGLSVIEVDGEREVTGITWGARFLGFGQDGDGYADGQPLVITDGTEGDVMVLELPASGRTGTAWRQEVLENVGLTWWARSLQPPE
ncbi:hypothetical protein [Rathayibacter sp. VKM Ac-2927]|uniref:protein kinase domain-containing protein n=1 Tax=Rathayibacter sp. VKM Ac-2927 TaxID=2929478 RepID=UPI001FB2D48D|nr:hypothetical protein [Rathayibacter sp. VKM Ac-2927]MCJ1688147.1 hypothetical protein [Rathayibacter sp. VKM Ac-2927]